mgnify:CR=1 FL=1
MTYEGEQRREFFRVSDHMLVEVVPVSEEMTQKPLTGEHFKSAPARHILDELEGLSDVCQQQIGALHARDPQLGKILETLCRRVGLLTQIVVSTHEDRLNAGARLVSLSEGGVSFHSASQHDAGTFLAIQLVPTSSNQVFRVYGRVSQCQLAAEGDAPSYNLGIEFIRLNSSLRERIARYVMKRQIEDRNEAEATPDMAISAGEASE